MGAIAVRFAGPVIAFLVASGLEVGGFEDIRIAWGLWSFAGLWAIVALLSWKGFRMRIAQLRAVSPQPQPAPALHVTVKRCRIDTENLGKYQRSVLAVDVVFKPTSPPLQLASVSLVFEGTERAACAMPTTLIEREQAETFLFAVGGSSPGFRLVQMGLNQGEGVGARQGKTLTEAEWPKGQLHVVSGALDFFTEPFLSPTPTKPLAPDKAESQR